MDQSEVEDLANRAGMSPDEYCLQRIAEWESMLSNFRTDYRSLSDEEFKEQLED